jgi:hypothetical protein
MIHVIGGGFTGLYLAYKLSKDHKVCVHESAPSVGGKCKKTVSCGGVQYEPGPWRVHSSHRHVRALCRKLGLHLDPNVPISKSSQAKLEQHARALEKGRGEFPGQGLSRADKLWWTEGAVGRDRSLETGYCDIDRQVDGKISKPTYLAAESEEFLHVREGMAALVRALRVALERRGGQVRESHGLREIHLGQGRFLNRLVFTSGPDVVTGTVFLCLPPHHLQELRFFRQGELWDPLRPLCSAVEKLALNHCYYRARHSANSKHRIAVDGLDNQRIPSQYGNEWSQVYTSGSLATSWFRMHQNFPQRVRQECGSDEVRMHYWHAGTFMWRPCTVFTTSKKALQKKIHFPLTREFGVTVCSEAFSFRQGWLEGAVESVHECLSSPTPPEDHPPGGKRTRVGAYSVSLDKLRKKWSALHPGGAEVLQSAGPELDSALARVAHSEHAWATAFHLAD